MKSKNTKFIVIISLTILIISIFIYIEELYRSGYINFGSKIDLDLFSKAMSFFSALFSGLIIFTLIISYISYEEQKTEFFKNQKILLQELQNFREQSFQNIFFHFIEYVNTYLIDKFENDETQLGKLENALKVQRDNPNKTENQFFINSFAYTNYVCRFLYQNFAPILLEIINLSNEKKSFNYQFYSNILFSNIPTECYIYVLLMFIQRKEFPANNKNCLINDLLSEWGNEYGNIFPLILNYCIENNCNGEIFVS